MSTRSHSPTEIPHCGVGGRRDELARTALEAIARSIAECLASPHVPDCLALDLCLGKS